MSQAPQHIYGPVMSRRLGRSLGVDLVPFKTCTYDCIYCQLGRTTDHTRQPRSYYDVDTIVSQIRRAVDNDDKIDYVSLAGSGEPTLNSQIGVLIDRIKTEIDLPLTVLTNGALLGNPATREALAPADVVLPSLDAGTPDTFRRICRPCEGLSFTQVVEGLISFSRQFGGEVWLEVMLLEGINTGPDELGELSRLARVIQPKMVQLNTVVRPPAERNIRAVPPGRMRELAGMFGTPVETIAYSPIGSEPVGDFVDDERILSYLRRRPTTAEDIASGLGVHRNVVSKRLQTLARRRLIKTIRRNDDVLYQLRSKDA